MNAIHPLFKERPGYFGFAIAIGAVGLSLLCRFLLLPFLGTASPWLIFAPAVILSAWVGGLEPGLFATVLSVIFGNFLLQTPEDSLVLHENLSGVIQLGVFLFLGLQTGIVNDKLLAAKQEAESTANPEAERYQQMQQLNRELEQQVRAQADQLRQAWEAESLLKRITDKVRDSLDEEQILLTVVRELALGMKVSACNTGLYDLHQASSMISYEHTLISPPLQGQVIEMARFPSIYGQLMSGWSFQFCSLEPSDPLRGTMSALVCPVFDNQGALGDLWLFRPSDQGFTEQEERLVQQVANQCAIAIRQVRLFEAAQAQVRELEKINQLKDDFLSTVSHELRTPVSNIKMAIQMLEITLKRQQAGGEKNPKALRYLQILQNECQREIDLINDLLDLQRFEVEAQSLLPDTIHLDTWLPEMMQPYQDRAATQKQIFETEIPDDLPPLFSYRSSLERILAELLDNACKYTPEGEKIRVLARPEKKTVQIQVINSGTEIPSQELPRIFDKFYRIPSTDPWKQGGTGLGLALVQQLVSQLGGQIWVDSGPNYTAFYVELPIQAVLARR